MANEKHLSKLKEGSVAWEAWINTQSGSHRANLSGANLKGADLTGFNLTNTILSKADLNGANLSGASLYGAQLIDVCLNGADLTNTDMQEARLDFSDLRRATFSDTNLSNANLSYANLHAVNISGAVLRGAFLSETTFSEAQLTGTDLSQSYIYGTDFRGANLCGADLSNAEVDEAIFGNTELSGATGLESIKHLGPSTIDHRTIQKTSPPLTNYFLRGCGLPDLLIDYYPTLLNRKNPYFSCFISYSHENKDFAIQIHDDLVSVGVRSWLDLKELKTGDRIDSQVTGAIREHDKVLLVLSEYSISSSWVGVEIRHALQMEKDREKTVLYPLSLDNAVLENSDQPEFELLRQKYIIDFSQWQDKNNYRTAFKKLIRDLTISASVESETAS